jgi:type II secretory pathway component GspD/PulD (secretin)
MTVDNKEATIEATQSRKFYSGSTSTSGYGSSNPTVTYNYTDKDIGIKIKVTPKINPNGTVMLEIEEEYSQLGAGQDVLVSGSNGTPNHETIDTSLTRKMSADILLENMQTVVLGGLTETYTSNSETGIPILKDIPWIGKWLFGSVSQHEDRKELLVFMTPYVLDEGDAAQAEALRETVPDFDFSRESANEDFARLLAAGLPVETAYEIVHRDELLESGMRYAARETERRLLGALAARGGRPGENALSSSGAALVKSDPRSMTKAERREIARRAMRGEKITF